MSVPSLDSVHVLCRFTFSYPAMNLSFCAVTAVSDMPWCLYTASWDPAPFSFATHHLSHTALSHTTFHSQLSHTQSFTQNFVTYTIFFVPHHLSHTTSSRTTLHIQLVLLLDPPPPPSSFLPSPSLLQHMLLIIGRNWLVGLSCPLILCMGEAFKLWAFHQVHIHARTDSVPTHSVLTFLRRSAAVSDWGLSGFGSLNGYPLPQHKTQTANNPSKVNQMCKFQKCKQKIWTERRKDLQKLKPYRLDSRRQLQRQQNYAWKQQHR